MSYGFDADRLLVWLAPREEGADPLRAGGLCKRHADAMVVPRGWTLDDRREPTPRLFRPAPLESEPAAEAQAEPERRSGAARRAASRSESRSEQLALDDDAGTKAATVAEVAGASPSDDPDETQAIPWLPDMNDDDALDGVLAAETPLLARAFRGTDRPRD